MEKKPYSKVWTNFETQSMAFVKLRTSIPYPEFIVRGYDGHLKIFKTTEDHKNPIEVLTLYVRASSSKEEVGFFKKSDTEYLLIGGDAAWIIAEKILPLLKTGG
jgi:hypothetical protein